MQLEKLQPQSCPSCGAEFHVARIENRRHVNGEQFERISYKCAGYTEWIPNFSKEKSYCPEVVKMELVEKLVDVFKRKLPDFYKNEEECRAKAEIVANTCSGTWEHDQYLDLFKKVLNDQ